MSKTPEEVQAMKDEIQAWLVKYRMTPNHTRWYDVREYYEGEVPDFDPPHYLMLGMDCFFYDIMLEMRPEDKAAKAEWDAILARHGCWWQLEDGGAAHIIDLKSRFPDD